MRTPPGPRKILEHLFLLRDLGEPELRPEILVQGSYPSSEVLSRYRSEAGLLGWRLIRRFLIEGFSVHLASAAEYARHTAGARQVARYKPHWRQLWFDAERLPAAPGLPVTRELGRALDHLIAGSVRGYAPSVTLWQGFAGQRAVPALGDYPRDYLARSVEAWFLPGGRAGLQRQDPGMHAFLDAVFSLSRD